jgi:hypothetical protein
MTYNLSKAEKLIDECAQAGIHVEQYPLPETVRGLYFETSETEPVISLSSYLKTQSEICSIVAEELGHYHTSCGDLLTDKKTDKTIIAKQENKAKRWAVKHLVPLERLVKAFESGSKNFYEMAEFLEITEEFLIEAFRKYNEIYGKYKEYGDYIIYFEPPAFFKYFKDKPAQDK